MPQVTTPLALTDDDRAELARWSKGGLPRLAERAQIVLACAEPGSGVARVAAELGSTRMTVRKWRLRFAEDGLAGLADHDRPGRPVADLVLTGAERDQLTRWARRASSAQAHKITQVRGSRFAVKFRNLRCIFDINESFGVNYRKIALLRSIMPWS